MLLATKIRLNHLYGKKNSAKLGKNALQFMMNTEDANGVTVSQNVHVIYACLTNCHYVLIH